MEQTTKSGELMVGTPYDVVTELPQALRWAAMHLEGVGGEADIETEVAKMTVRGIHTVVLTPEQAARARF